MSDKLVIAGEMFDAFYKEQTDNGTADGSIWEYKDDIEKLMVEYHNAQMDSILEHIKRIADNDNDTLIHFFKREVELSSNSFFASEILNMKTNELIEFINVEFPHWKESVFYSILILKSKTNK